MDKTKKEVAKATSQNDEGKNEKKEVAAKLITADIGDLTENITCDYSTKVPGSFRKRPRFFNQ